jgi:rSAM/selenodomain-associated transferase 1
MTSSAPRPEARVAVFAKAPVAGAVKTRLAAILGPQGAAGLHAELVRRALATAVASRALSVELWCSPDTRDPFFARCADEFGVTLRTQEGEDLGERMRRAFEGAFASGSALVIIGGDCPALAPRDVSAAIDALDEYDAVVVPAEDGGYVLIGLARPVAALFESIAWGGDGVMDATRARLASAGVRWKELGTLWDVDRPEDYARMIREGLLGKALT